MPPAKKAAPVAKKAAARLKKVAVPPKKSAGSKAAVAKAAIQATITLKHLAANLAESHDLPKKQAEDCTWAISSHLFHQAPQEGRQNPPDRRLGILQVRSTRPDGTVRNPATGETIKIKASRKIAFRPAKELKEAV